MQRDFVTWEALDGENTRIWKTLYCPRALYELWTTWRAWLEEQRTLLIITREVYEEHHGQRAQPCLL